VACSRVIVYIYLYLKGKEVTGERKYTENILDSCFSGNIKMHSTPPLMGLRGLF
jgi:hypothetical protein